MINNSYSPQSHSPLLPAEEGEEWVPVVQWVRKTVVPSTQAGTHESQIVTSPLLSQFSMPTDTPQSFYPSQIWNQSQLVGMNNYSSPTSTSSPLNNASSPLNNTSFSGSPVDQLFDDFDIDAAIQDSNLFNADQSLLGLTDQSLFGFAHHSLLGLSGEHLLSAPTSDPSLFDADLFDTFVDFSGAELGFSPTPASTRSFASSTTAAVSPTSFTEGLEGFSVLTPYSSAPSVATPDLTSYSSLRTGAQAAGATPNSTTSSPPLSPSSQALFPCTYGHCNHVFDNANNLRRHERKHRSNFKCEICGKPHIDKRGLSRHMWAQHPDEAKQRNTRSEVIKCNECDYTGRSDNVARHARHRHKR